MDFGMKLIVVLVYHIGAAPAKLLKYYSEKVFGEAPMIDWSHEYIDGGFIKLEIEVAGDFGDWVYRSSERFFSLGLTGRLYMTKGFQDQVEIMKIEVIEDKG